MAVGITNAQIGSIANPYIATTDAQMANYLADTAKKGSFVLFSGSSASGSYVSGQIYRILDSGDIEQYAPKADTVQKGLVFEDYDSDGFPHTVKLVGMTNIPNDYCRGTLNGSTDNNFASRITSLTIPSIVTSIGEYAFTQSTLKSIIWEEPINLNAENVKVGAFSSCYDLDSIIIPSHWNKVPEHFLSGAQSLTNIVIPENVTAIGMTAFEYCTKLVNVTLPKKLERLENSCFKNCNALISLTIPSSITYVSYSALHIGTTSNKATITFKGTTPPTIETNTFDTAKLNKIYVPSASLEAYKTAEKWSAFANYIEADPNE